MPDILGTMFFEQGVGSRATGWSESMFLIGDADDKAALTHLGVVATARVKLLGAGCVLTYLRVSDVNVYRDSQVANGPPPGALNPPIVLPAGTKIEQANQAMYNFTLRDDPAVRVSPTSIFCDLPWSGLLIRMEAAAPYTGRRSLVIRGNPDYVQQIMTDVPMPGPYMGALTDYMNLLVNGKQGFRGIDTTNANPLKAISVLNPTQPQPILTIAAPGLIPGTHVRIAGTKLADALGNNYKFDGLWTVQTNANGALTFYGMTTPLPNLTVLAPGNIREQKKAVMPFAKALARRWTRRDTGLPFDPLHGRRKKRK